MKVLVTGANGFIGKNLVEALIQVKKVEIVKHLRGDSVESLFEKLKTTDLIFHIAGVNRNHSDLEFVKGNLDSTSNITNYLLERSRSIPIVFTSSIQSGSESIYGKTKAAAESLILRYAELSGAPVKIYRLPNVFGKFSKPDYNSVVATFCYRTINNIPVVVFEDLRRELAKFAVGEQVVIEFERVSYPFESPDKSELPDDTKLPADELERLRGRLQRREKRETLTLPVTLGKRQEIPRDR